MVHYIHTYIQYVILILTMYFSQFGWYPLARHGRPSCHKQQVYEDLRHKSNIIEEICYLQCTSVTSDAFHWPGMAGHHVASSKSRKVFQNPWTMKQYRFGNDTLYPHPRFTTKQYICRDINVSDIFIVHPSINHPLHPHIKSIFILFYRILIYFHSYYIFFTIIHT